MEPEASSVCLSILAATDAVWLPLRNWSLPGPVNTYFARGDFARYGVPWHSGGGSEADRKEAQRLLEGLATQGFVKVFRPHGLKALGVRLTDKCEVQARRLCGLPGLETGLCRLAEVVRLCAEAQKGCVAEEVLAGVAWGTPGAGKAYARVEDQVLPVLVRGWLKSEADGVGHVYYHATAAGRRALAETPADQLAHPPGEAEVPKDGASKEAYGFYLLNLDAALARLATADPSDRREIGLLPLPVSMGGRAAMLPRRAPLGLQAPGVPGSPPGVELAPTAQRGANGARPRGEEGR